MKNMGGIKTLVLAALVLTIGLVAGMPLSAEAQSDAGLVAEYHFDEGSGNIAKDSSGNGNDGIIYGATWVDGKFGKALSFDGVDDYVDLGAYNSEQTVYTVMAWFKSSDNGGMILHRGDSGDCFYNPVIFVNGSLIFSESGCRRSGYVKGDFSISSDVWYHIALTRNGETIRVYIDGMLKATDTVHSDPTYISQKNNGKFFIGSLYHSTNRDLRDYFKGIIDEVRIYNRALSAEEIQTQYEGQTALTVKKEISPYSIRQYQTTNVTIQIKNSGTLEIKDIEIVDSTNPNLDLVGGEFPNPKKYNSLVPGESREIQYVLKSKESGTLILEPVTVSYADDKGNIKVVKSEPISLTVVPSSEGADEGSSPAELGSSSAVLLHGEKTDVVLGEDILLKLSAVNLITKPPMTVQVILYPPSGMSVTGSEFVESGAGIYTTTYTLDPGKGRDIEVHIKSNQVGDFGVKGRIVYFFGDDKKSAEDHTLTLPIKVRKEPGQIGVSPSSSNDGMAAQKAPGFAGGIAIIGILFVSLFIKRGAYK